ncbi:MAG: hypothetical protein JWM80_5603 [Cyanobacteria bacterium RYN_339]|nr:hypothetical protein [Cyanobacteria bacterium RYN_339]
MSKVHKHAPGASHGHGAGKSKDGHDDGPHKGHGHELPDEQLFEWQHDFAGVDKNHDGKLAKSELKVHKQAKAFDQDKDGTVSREEYRAGFRQGNSFAGLDKDHDGALDAAELKRAHRFTDDSFDGDQDGKVSSTEFVAGRKTEEGELLQARRDYRFKHLGTKQKKALKGYDTDHNGHISRQEFGAGRDADRLKAANAKIAENFALAGGKDGAIANADQTAYKGYDADHDNAVSEDEFLAGQKADRHERWDNVLAGKQDPALAQRLHLDALGQGINKLTGGAAPGAAPAAPGDPNAPPTSGTDFTISSFNVLGSSHTAAGGKDPGMASGPERMKGVVELMKKHDVDVVGFQEMQHDQAAAFQKQLGDKYALYPGTKGDSENSIAWRKDKFDLVKTSSIAIPYFNGHTRHMPVVLLRDKQTGQLQYICNFHNPADTAQFHHQQKYRTEAMHREIALVNKLRQQTGLPVFVTGDMNEGNEYYNGMTHGAKGMHSSTGLPSGRPPKNPGIDWIFGSQNVTFSDQERDHGALVRHTTDHPMIIAHAHVDKTERKR